MPAKPPPCRAALFIGRSLTLASRGARARRTVMRYLLDTNMVSDLVCHPQGRIADHVRNVGETKVCTSVVVAAELRYGAAKQRPRKTKSQAP